MSKWPYNTSTWQRLRAAKLSSRPLCEPCERRGKTVLARHVDHIVEINAGGPAFPGLDGLMSMCVSCHTIKTNAVKSGKGSKFRGCDVDGNPIDPDDGWFEPAAFRSRPIESCGTVGETNADLVSLQYNNKESDRWV